MARPEDWRSLTSAFVDATAAKHFWLLLVVSHLMAVRLRRS